MRRGASSAEILHDSETELHHSPSHDRQNTYSERFVVLLTITDRHLAARVCTLLEEESISVLIEHVEIVDGVEGGLSASGYRVLVPTSSVKKATKILSTVQDAFSPQAMN